MRARERLERSTGLDLAPFFAGAFVDSPNPELSLTNLERWLASTTSPRLQLEHLLEQPQLASMLVMLLGASQPLADCLIQNPELASIVSDETERLRAATRAEIERAGRVLIKASTSYSHSLDRLRFLRQRWMLSITVNDLCGSWQQEEVWQALSDLADALITLAVEVVWAHFARERNLPPVCPLLVVGFGKLGGHELNYSSDIDLAYVGPNDMSEELEKQNARFCEALGRAISDRMGRGMLYRVDLRLRPYGKAGPVLNSMRSVEDYYRRYAEPWEALAMLRSRAICGPKALAEGWERLRRETCFKPTVSEMAVDHLMQDRARTEAAAAADDLKRGRGGIRDVEFVTQILQLLHGHRHQEARARPTCEALRGLTSVGVIDQEGAEALIDGYTFLRKVEHRCQLEGEQQTHTIPVGDEPRRRLAHTMGLPDWRELDSLLATRRRKIADLYELIVASGPTLVDSRGDVLGQLGQSAPSAAHWLDAMPESASFYRTLEQSEASFARVERVVRQAPLLLPMLKESLPLTEAIVSGEIEEEDGKAEARIARLEKDCSLTHLSQVYASAWLKTVTRWAIADEFDLSKSLCSLTDALLRHCASRLYAEFAIIALGSYGREEIALDSDADLLLLLEKPELHDRSEQQAQDFLALISQLRRHGAPIQVDLRLRPEGRQGLLVRTYDGLRAYELEAMEMWERFALGQARLIYGDQSAIDLVTKVAYAQPLTPERLRELLEMKMRIENERVSARYIRRNIKLGHGGLGDIEWFVHIYEMRYPTATRAGASIPMTERIRSLAKASLINMVEADELLQAREYLVDLRHRLALLDIKDAVLPENPDRLDVLSSELGFSDGNSLLRRHERVVDTVRLIYTDGMERLKAWA